MWWFIQFKLIPLSNDPKTLNLTKKPTKTNFKFKTRAVNLFKLLKKLFFTIMYSVNKVMLLFSIIQTDEEKPQTHKSI